MPLSLDGTGSITGIVTVSVSDDLAHIGDTNTKISFPANDTISFETNGAERLRIRSDGKVGIGTDMVGAPASNYGFGFYRATGTAYLYTETGQSGASAGLRAKAGTSDFTIFTTQGVGQLAVYDNTNSAERLRITSAGQVLVGISTAANTQLVVYGDGTNDNKPAILFQNDLTGTGNSQGIFIGGNHDDQFGYVWNYESQPVVIGTNNAERLRISSVGNASLGLGADAVPTASSYNAATLHLHQPSNGSYGSQIKMTTAAGGSTASDGFYIAHWGGNSSTFLYNKENTPIYFGTNSVERFVIKNDGDVSITDGNLIVASGHGISFAASGNFGTMNSEILDDYEEGYWTPTIGGHISNGSSSYGNQKGAYVRIGAFVYLSWYISWTSTNASGQFRIYGQPYAAATTYGTNYNITTGSMMFDNITTPYANGQMVPYLSNGANQIVFYGSYYTSGWDILSHDSTTTNGGSMIASITYRAA